MSANPEPIILAMAEWRSLLPLSPEHDRRLWQKLRLEWNYHSNHIEGNTLTYGETELLLIHGQTHGNHTLREYEEMQAHDVGIAHLRELAEDRTRLIGETDIRNLNKIILKEPFWKPAQTPDGQATRKQIIPGEYKIEPNNVLTATGELFEFAPPSDVPARMSSLVEWLGASLHEFRDADLLWLLARLHHNFVLIHPFDDGNGRVARMLVNYVLMRLGYPPVIVPTERKRDYLAALRLADAGEITELENFLGGCVIRSLELGIKAAKGESLDEPGDVEKEVALFVRSEQVRNKKIGLPSKEVLGQLAEVSFFPFINELERRMETLKPMFSKYEVETENLRGSVSRGSGVSRSEISYQIPGGQILMTFRFIRYRGEASTPFDHTTAVGIHFPPGKYTITHDDNVLISKSYCAPVLIEEIDEVTSRILAKTFGVIRGKASPRA